MGVVDIQALAQRVETVLLPGIFLARERQRVEHPGAAAQAAVGAGSANASSASRNARSNAALWMISSASPMNSSNSSAICANSGLSSRNSSLIPVDRRAPRLRRWRAAD